MRYVGVRAPYFRPDTESSMNLGVGGACWIGRLVSGRSIDAVVSFRVYYEGSLAVVGMMLLEQTSVEVMN